MLHTFKAGDFVVCRDASATQSDPLVRGRMYTVQSVEWTAGITIPKLHLEGKYVSRSADRFNPATSDPPSLSHWGMHQ